MRLMGMLLLCVGLLGVVVAFGMDTTVPAGGGRVYNIGLMGLQQNVLLASLALAAVGLAMWLMARRDKPAAEPQITQAAGAYWVGPFRYESLAEAEAAARAAAEPVKR